MAPASRARSTSSRWENAVRITTGAICSAAIRSAAEMPSRTGILTSRIDQIRLQLRGELDRLLAVRRLADDLVALFLQHLLEVEPDQRLVFGYDHAQGCLAHRHEGTETARSARSRRYAGFVTAPSPIGPVRPARDQASRAAA